MLNLDLLRTLIGLQNRLIATLWITTFGAAFKRKYTMVAIVILSQRLMRWREEFVTFGMSVQRISLKSAKQ